MARELTGARYAALGILDEDRRELERFIYVGIDEETRAMIGDLPRGLGVLGELIRNPAPLRLREVGEHPRSHGFPPGHPPMHSFLGVPIVVRGQVYGNLYLTEKVDGDFEASDQEAATILAEWAAVTIFNVRLYAHSEEERGALERAVHGLEATTEISRAVGGETETTRVLETIAKRSRALVGARSLLVLLRDGARFEVVAAAGECGRRRSAAISARRDLGRDPGRGAGDRDRGPRRPARSAALPWQAPGGDYRPRPARGRAGFLPRRRAAADRGGGECRHRRCHGPVGDRGAPAPEPDERRARAGALGPRTARLGPAGSGLAPRAALLGLEERRPGRLSAAVEEALAGMARDIDELRALITELRPATLDQLGLVAALEDLAERVDQGAELELSTDLQIDAERLESELETVVYRLVQEALTNIVKHAGAVRVDLQIQSREGRLDVIVSDDGKGFEPSGERAASAWPGCASGSSWPGASCGSSRGPAPAPG